MLDNAPCHPRHKKPLRNISLFFLPPNTTSKTQPMDQGGEAPPKVDVLTALRLVYRGWRGVKASSIANCYQHCGFIAREANATDEADDSFDEEDAVPLATLLARVKDIGADVELSTALDWISCDEDTATCATLTDNDIIAMVQPSNTEDEDAEDVPDAVVEDHDAISVQTREEALLMCDKLMAFLESRTDAGTAFDSLGDVSSFVKKVNTYTCMSAIPEKQSILVLFTSFVLTSFSVNQ
ncbi:hypothetical protein CAPTEDRAFT_203573 [Capitella teleta]|uniref:DDE-1 domain-containing protein n=1 Tax=Capitella teleta TaxID=283909 RepID=R7V167_CAPTE|nr:hypothetical protein CAPTEDRAFT_203573 [Capitella teleta]|eukprot:ELU12217.1 hypothetical protein CAPTEDRAFT_203573 [Capitella teleta]